MAGKGAPKGNAYARSKYDSRGHGVMIYISAPEWATFGACLAPESVSDQAIIDYAREVFHQAIAQAMIERPRPYDYKPYDVPRITRKMGNSFRHAINVWMTAKELDQLKTLLSKNAQNNVINDYARQVFHAAAEALTP